MIYIFDCGYCFKLSEIKIEEDDTSPKYCPFCGEVAEEEVEGELDFDA